MPWFRWTITQFRSMWLTSGTCDDVMTKASFAKKTGPLSRSALVIPLSSLLGTAHEEFVDQRMPQDAYKGQLPGSNPVSGRVVSSGQTTAPAERSVVRHDHLPSPVAGGDSSCPSATLRSHINMLNYVNIAFVLQ